MTGIEGYDWSIFGGNPVPGDPDTVRAIAGRMRDLADEAGLQNRLLGSVGSDASSVWYGPAADAFKPVAGRLPGELAKLVDSYRDAADALDRYWPALRGAQGLAVEALRKANAATHAIGDARARLAAAESTSGRARAGYDQAASSVIALRAPTQADMAQLTLLQTGYQNAQVQVSSAANALGAAQAQLAAAHSIKDRAVGDYTAAARRVAGGLAEASAAGIRNPHHRPAGVVGPAHAPGPGAAKPAAPGWIGHHGTDSGLGPVNMLLSSHGRHVIEEGLRDAGPVLDAAAGVLGTVSLALAVVALAPVIGRLGGGAGPAAALVDGEAPSTVGEYFGTCLSGPGALAHTGVMVTRSIDAVAGARAVTGHAHDLEESVSGLTAE